ncbi:MAG TPA: efflux transporter outer membrane subunit, partial [Usitatibacter sp.]|nr:efflux transporter outer membrane subunit [Usitatibacter sp.]
MKKAILLLSLLLAGCAVGPDYKQPEVAAPPLYKGATDWQVAQPSDTVPKGQWWKAFRDPILDGLVERVEVSNQNLRAAEARYRQAQAGIAAARSALFPTLGASVGAQRTGGRANAGNSGTRYTASLDARWEVDLWGRVRRTVEASSAGAEASAADLENARLSLQADLATSYFLLRVTDTQIDLLEDNVTAFRKSLEIAQNRYAAGVAAKVDVVQAEAQVRSIEAQAIDLRATRAQLENAIAVLAGEPPPTFVLAKEPFKAHIPEIPPGVPSRLLERRPDIAAAERRVAQANAQIGVAQAAYFPALNLTGGAGTASSSLGNLFSASNYAWSLGLGLAATLVDFGARGAQVDAS